MEQAIPILPTEDLAAAKAFYVDGLGFSVTFEYSPDGRSGLIGLERGTIRITLDRTMEGHGRDACVSLQIDDADAYYREWSAKVAVLRSPMDESWGARTFRGGRDVCTAGKAEAKGCEIPKGGPPPATKAARPQRGAAPILGLRGPQAGASISGTRAVGALGPAPTNDLLDPSGNTIFVMGPPSGDKR